MYNAHFFLTHFASKIEMRIIHTQNLLFSYELICITQKIQSRTTPSFTEQGEINQDKKFVKLYTSLQYTSYLCQFKSHMLPITIENHLHFLKYFDDKIIYMKNFLKAMLKFVTPISLMIFCTKLMRKDLKEKRSWKYAPHLEFIMWPASLVRSRSPPSENRLQNRGVHCTQVNMVIKILRNQVQLSKYNKNTEPG